MLERATTTAASPAPSPAATEPARLHDLTPAQWKSGIAAWLGWLFDGLDMHLYTIVAALFVAELMGLGPEGVRSDAVARNSSIIQASFLVGWAVGGWLFGLVGDRLGRSRALVLTILTYAVCTGLSCVATAWWHLLIFRFLAALGIGGEWAVGSSLLAETWPSRWRPWIAATLQTAVNVGVLLAMVAGFLMSDLPPRYVFLVGIAPALIVVWIRKAVPEPTEWHVARTQTADPPSFWSLFDPPWRRITWLSILVCSLSLTAHWAFMFWSLQHLPNLPDVASWSDGERRAMVAGALSLIMVSAIAGNYLAAAIARVLGFRRAIALMCVVYGAAVVSTYYVPRGLNDTLARLTLMGAASGVFGLFTMYLPALFPVLLRTSGAGFCYNIGRVAAAAGTMFFGLFSKVGDHRLALFYSGFLFLPAAVFALLLPEPRDEVNLPAATD